MNLTDADIPWVIRPDEHVRESRRVVAEDIGPLAHRPQPLVSGGDPESQAARIDPNRALPRFEARISRGPEALRAVDLRRNEGIFKRIAWITGFHQPERAILGGESERIERHRQPPPSSSEPALYRCRQATTPPDTGLVPTERKGRVVPGALDHR